MWKTRHISKHKNKTVAHRAFATPALIYGSECWHIQKEDKRGIQEAETSWLRGRTMRIQDSQWDNPPEVVGTEGNTGRQDQKKKTDIAWSCSKNER